nr:hypothetical protein [Pseudomonas sp. Ost2]
MRRVPALHATVVVKA